MSRVSVADHAKLSWLVLRGGLRRFAGWLSGHPLLRLSIIPLKTERLLIAPQELRTADGTRASEIYSGRFAFAGKVVVCDGRSVFETQPPSEEWAVALLGFGWLRHLRAAESAITRANARALVDEWITLQGSWHPLAWRPDVLSRRVISWLSQSTLLLQDADVRYYRRFLRSLLRQVRYLRHTAGDATPRLASPARETASSPRPSASTRRSNGRYCQTAAISAAIPKRSSTCCSSSCRCAMPSNRAISRRRSRCSTPSTA